MTKKKFFSAVTTFTIIFSLAMFAALLVWGQDVEPGPEQEKAKVNEIKIPELNLLRIQNLNFRFQLLVTQRTRIEEELQKIQVEVFTELGNVRKSLDADSENWNVDLVKGVFVRKPVAEEKKE